jgi:hypothetical protein
VFNRWGYLVWALLGLIFLSLLLTSIVLDRAFLVGEALIFLVVATGMGFLGGLLWVSAAGRWPGGRKQTRGKVRLLLPLLPLAVNGFIGITIGSLLTCTGDFLCSGMSVGMGAAIGLGIFLGLALVETTLFLMAWGIIRLGRALLRGSQ